MDVEELFEKHVEAFKQGKIPVTMAETELKFKDKQAVAEHLKKGEIIPELFRQCVSASLTVYQQIGMYTLLEFSSKKARANYKKAFVYAVSKLINP